MRSHTELAQCSKIPVPRRRRALKCPAVHESEQSCCAPPYHFLPPHGSPSRFTEISNDSVDAGTLIVLDPAAHSIHHSSSASHRLSVTSDANSLTYSTTLRGNTDSFSDILRGLLPAIQREGTYINELRSNIRIKTARTLAVCNTINHFVAQIKNLSNRVLAAVEYLARLGPGFSSQLAGEDRDLSSDFSDSSAHLAASAAVGTQQAFIARLEEPIGDLRGDHSNRLGGFDNVKVSLESLHRADRDHLQRWSEAGFADPWYQIQREIFLL